MIFSTCVWKTTAEERTLHRTQTTDFLSWRWWSKERKSARTVLRASRRHSSKQRWWRWGYFIKTSNDKSIFNAGEIRKKFNRRSFCPRDETTYTTKREKREREREREREITKSNESREWVEKEVDKKEAHNREIIKKLPPLPPPFVWCCFPLFFFALVYEKRGKKAKTIRSIDLFLFPRKDERRSS